MKTSRRSFVQGMLGSMIMITFAGVQSAASTPRSFPLTSIILVTRSSPEHFQVELAATAVQRIQGLQGRRTLDPRSGMLFVFDSPAVTAMWMKNTYIPLDMLFVDEGGGIIAIAKNTQPMSLEPIRSPGPVKAVLELNAGTVERLGIVVGDRVLHPIFEN